MTSERPRMAVGLSCGRWKLSNEAFRKFSGICEFRVSSSACDSAKQAQRSADEIPSRSDTVQPVPPHNLQSNLAIGSGRSPHHDQHFAVRNGGAFGDADLQ